MVDGTETMLGRGGKTWLTKEEHGGTIEVTGGK
jgi:hypothetical protein